MFGCFKREEAFKAEKPSKPEDRKGHRGGPNYSNLKLICLRRLEKQ